MTQMCCFTIKINSGENVECSNYYFLKYFLFLKNIFLFKKIIFNINIKMIWKKINCFNKNFAASDINEPESRHVWFLILTYPRSTPFPRYSLSRSSRHVCITSYNVPRLKYYHQTILIHRWSHQRCR
jgi:hypothetical protein